MTMAPARGRRPHVWTIGYEGHDPESLVLFLRRAKVQRVVDIRELPLSRKAGFSKRALALGLQRAGIAYSHARALGTPRAVRHAYKAGGSYEEFRAAYVSHLAEQVDAVGALKELARGERCALLCVEHEPGTCHRGILADALAGEGWRVTHL